LRNELILSRESISAAFEIDYGEGCSWCSKHAGLRGHRAVTLAADLRRRYKLPPFSSDEASWGFKSTLQDEHDKAMKDLERWKAIVQSKKT